MNISKPLKMKLEVHNMQNQNIAQYSQYCGIPDVNYFIKIFKKVMNKTPSEFKEEIR